MSINFYRSLVCKSFYEGARWQKTLGGSVVAHARVQLSVGLYQEFLLFSLGICAPCVQRLDLV
jgi:hypothetical protein